MAYSIDFRKRAIAYRDKGHTPEELYEAFEIYPARINEWNSLEPQYPKTRQVKIDLQKLKQELERKPDLILPELAEIFGCKKQSVDAALKKAKITRKKELYLRRKNPDKCDFLYYVIGLICLFYAISKFRFCR